MSDVTMTHIMRDTAQLLIFIRTIDFNFKLSEELASMEPLKSTTTHYWYRFVKGS